MQRLTTHEPDDSMLECAIAAMQLVLAREEQEEQEEQENCAPEASEKAREASE